MKKTKKLLSFLMAAALSLSCFTAVPIVSQAANRLYYTAGDYTFYLDNGNCVISGYSGSEKDLIIPSTIAGRTVVAIDKVGISYSIGVFEGHKEITSVTIPDTIQAIGERAFYGCSSLTDLDLGNGVKTLGNYCFKDCDSLTSIHIPLSLTSSDSSSGSAFTNCDSLKTVTFESGAVKIPALFPECTALESIDIPDGVQRIGGFGGSGLKEIKIPASVQTIDDSAFWKCKSLKKVIISNSAQIKIGREAFYGCSYLEDFYDYSDNAEYYEPVTGLGSLSDGPTISDTPFLTMHGFEGSSAQKYANSNNIRFVPFTEKQMYRLYNKYSGEHFYTSASTEKDNLVTYGWTYEGTAWIAPNSSNSPVYRLYNPNSGEHHYTMDAVEKDYLVGLGWKDEGIGWYSDDNQGTPLYRLYNPNATGDQEAGGHHYTKDVNEKNSLIAAGWRDEGIGWYGI